MALEEYNSLNEFPIELVTIDYYEVSGFEDKVLLKLNPGDSFIGIKKETIGQNDFSIIDNRGHPYHYTNCNLK